MRSCANARPFRLALVLGLISVLVPSLGATSVADAEPARTADVGLGLQAVCTPVPFSEYGPCAAISGDPNPADRDPMEVTFSGSPSLGENVCTPPPTGGLPVCTLYPITSYDWVFYNGSGGVIATASGVSVTQLFMEPGGYTVELTVTVGATGNSDTTSKGISIPENTTPTTQQLDALVEDQCDNARPATVGFPVTFIAFANEPDPIQTLVGELHTGEPGKDKVLFSVPPVAKPLHTGITSVTYTAPGTYEPEFRVRDSKFETYGVVDGLSHTGDPALGDSWHPLTGTDLVVAPDTNWEPEATFDAVPMSGNAPLTVDFDAGDSCEPDGTITDFEWDYDDGSPVESTGTTETTSHTYTSAGEYYPSVTVTDDEGASTTYTTPDPIVVAGDEPPVIEAFDTPDFVWIDDPAQLSARATDSDGVVTTFEWDIDGDGSVDATTSPDTPAADVVDSYTTTYSVVGPVTPAVRVIDDDGSMSAWTTASLPIQVIDPDCEGDVDGDGIPCFFDGDPDSDPGAKLIRVRLTDGPGAWTDGLVPGLSDAALTNPLDLRLRRVLRGTPWEQDLFTGPFAFTNPDLTGDNPGVKDGILNLFAERVGASCTDPLIGEKFCDTGYIHGVGLCIKSDPFKFNICRYHAMFDDDQGTFEFREEMWIRANFSGTSIRYHGSIIPFLGGSIHVEAEPPPDE